MIRQQRASFIPPPLLTAVIVLGFCAACNQGDGTDHTSKGAATAAPTESRSGAESAEAPGAEVDCFVIVDAEPDLGAPPLQVVFETEVDCTSEPVTYKWDFGDGAVGGNEPNPTHLYPKEGDFLATVTVTAPDGAIGTDEIDISVDEMLGD